MRTVIGILITVALALPAAAEDIKLDSPEGLMERLTVALEAQDANQLDNLHFWDGVDPAHADALRDGFETKFFECNARPKSIVPGSFMTEEFVRGGYRYRPNLEIEGRIDFQCTTGRRAGFQVPYGSQGGRYYLVNVTRDPDSGSR